MRCPDCWTEDPALHYRSGRVARCIDSDLHARAVARAKREGLGFSKLVDALLMAWLDAGAVIVPKKVVASVPASDRFGHSRPAPKPGR